MNAGDPEEFEAPGNAEGEQEVSFDADSVLGEHALSRDDQNGDTRLTAGGRR